jgi:hypothetical protein
MTGTKGSDRYFRQFHVGQVANLARTLSPTS